jgi:hypothetical protein
MLDAENYALIRIPAHRGPSFWSFKWPALVNWLVEEERKQNIHLILKKEKKNNENSMPLREEFGTKLALVYFFFLCIQFPIHILLVLLKLQW